MDGDIWKFAITALGSGGLVGLLVKVVGPALKLNASGAESSARAIAQWEKLFTQQQAETVAVLGALEEAREALAKAEARGARAERKAAEVELKLNQALDRIRQLEEKTP